MVKDSSRLVEIIEKAKRLGSAAIDTEFVWERTYFPQLGLIQVGLPDGECHLLDVLSIEDLSPLGELISDPNTLKILHDAQQDLYILRRATGAYPKNVFDTRLAAGFAGLTSTISLSALVKELLGIDLPKTESRTDWLKRPLSQGQLEYAADDVRYLHAAVEELLARINGMGRKSWLDEELGLYDEESLYYEKDPKTQYLRLKGAGRMRSAELSVLRELAAWREEEARRHDRPRGHIVKDEALVLLAKSRPATIDNMESLKGINEKDIRCYGKEIIGIIKEGGEGKGLVFPESEKNGSDKTGARADFIFAYLKSKCIDLLMDISLLASKAEISSFVSCFSTGSSGSHRLMKGWRKVFAGDELVRLMSGDGSLRINKRSGLPVFENPDKP